MEWSPSFTGPLLNEQDSLQSVASTSCSLPAGNSPNDQQGLFPSRNRVGQRLIRQLMGQILLAGEEP
jgi:hypothetical protein